MRLSLFVPCDPTADHSSVPPARNWCPWRAPPETSVGGRREGDILLRVLPKSRGQQYRVRSDVRARLIRGLEAPLKLGLLPDTRPQLPKTTKRSLNFHHSGCREAA